LASTGRLQSANEQGGVVMIGYRSSISYLLMGHAQGGARLMLPQYDEGQLLWDTFFVD
jgi:hypothetical protein